MRIRKKSSRKPLIIAIVAAVILLSGGIWAYNHFSNQAEDSSARPVNDVDYGPPTEEEKSAGDIQKEKLDQTNPDETTDPTNAPDQPKQVKVVITDAGQYDDVIEVRSFIPDHYQDGTCTIALTKDDQTVTKKTTAYRDASTTICTNPLIKRSEIPSAGDWEVRVQYTSTDASGTSEPQTITIT